MTATHRAVTYRGRTIGWWLTDRQGLCRYLSAGTRLLTTKVIADRSLSMFAERVAVPGWVMGMTYAERFGSSVER